MFFFLIKGLVRDKSRFLLPLLVIIGGAALTVMMEGYIGGWITELIIQNACNDTGHVKVMTRAYAKKKSQRPNELALLEVDSLITQLKQDYPEWIWQRRIHFGGILDTASNPDKTSETSKQGPISGLAIDFIETGCQLNEIGFRPTDTFGSSKTTSPSDNPKAVIGIDLSEKLNLKKNDEFLFMGSTMYGGLAFRTLVVDRVVHFGIKSFDRGTVLVDYRTAEQILDMENAAGEILGFRSKVTEGYDFDEVDRMVSDFNARQSDDRFAPEMVSLLEQNRLRDLIAYYKSATFIFIAVFVVAMSLVLWNTGLISGIRRYQEFGIRLALGESKRDVYGYLILEAACLGFFGALIGTLIGLVVTYFINRVGIDYSSLLQNSSALIPTVIRAEFSLTQVYIGFIPGLFSVILGTALAGIGIFKRETALLLKELEV